MSEPLVANVKSESDAVRGMKIGSLMATLTSKFKTKLFQCKTLIIIFPTTECPVRIKKKVKNRKFLKAEPARIRNTNTKKPESHSVIKPTADKRETRKYTESLNKRTEFHKLSHCFNWKEIFIINISFLFKTSPNLETWNSKSTTCIKNIFSYIKFCVNNSNINLCLRKDANRPTPRGIRILLIYHALYSIIILLKPIIINEKKLKHLILKSCVTIEVQMSVGLNRLPGKCYNEIFSCKQSYKNKKQSMNSNRKGVNINCNQGKSSKEGVYKHFSGIVNHLLNVDHGKVCKQELLRKVKSFVVIDPELHQSWSP